MRATHLSDSAGDGLLASLNESNPGIDSPHTSAIPGDISGTSVDGGTESDQFMSFPTTPTDDDTFFWQDSYSFSVSPHVSTAFPEPYTPQDTANVPAAHHSPQTSAAKERSRAQTPEAPPPPEDYSCPVKGMYRLLDLITELGSSGLVDKIVVAQQSLQAFINALSPGAYSSITKVNFKNLDNYSLKLLGVYGSKEEIVRFLREINAVDDNTAGKLLTSQDGITTGGSEPILRSGLYVVRSFVSTAEELAYVLYWPEDTTWNDQAVTAVQRNRVTFMRYLTKLCDQIVCLLSPEHSQAIVWGDEDGHGVSTVSNNSARVSGSAARLFDFVVAKTNDQEENVTTRIGFTMDSPLLVYQQSPPEIHIENKDLSPRLLNGETMQGFMTAEFKQAETLVECFDRSDQDASQIRLLLGDDVVLRLSEKIDDKSLKALMELGVRDRFPNEFATWEKRGKEIKQRFQEALTRRIKDTHLKLEGDLEDMKVKLRDAVIIEVLKAFPSVQRQDVLPKSNSVEGAGYKVEPGDVTDPLRDFFGLYPKLEHIFRGNISIAHLEKGMKNPEFQSKKERILIQRYLLENISGLDKDEIRTLADAILDRENKKAALALLKVTRNEEKGSISDDRGSTSDGSGYRVFDKVKTLSEFVKIKANEATSAIGNIVETVKGSGLAREEALWRGANIASSVPDSCFLSQLSTAHVDECLRDAIVEVEETAYTCLRKLIESLVDGFSQQFLTTQKEDCDKQIKREIASGELEKKELGIIRSEFVRGVKDLSRERSRSSRSIYVRSFAAKKENRYSRESYSIKYRQESQQNQEIKYYVHTLRLKAEQKHNLQLDASFVPTPMLTRNNRLSQSFCVSFDTTIKYAHLLEGDRILLGLVDSQGNILIFLDKLSRIDAAIKNKSPAKVFHQDKIGPTCLFAFDESKSMLAVYAPAKMQLHVFVFDEELKSLRGLGTAIDLSPFYDTGVSIVHACFVHGSEEILFVDSSAQARIFSLITLQPRPASLKLSQIPRAVYSSPDGSCVLAVQDEDGVSTLTAYHWSTFASTDGISVILPDFPVDLDAALLTSIINRNNVHLIGLDLESRSCRSVVLDITRRVTEFNFQERRPKAPSGHGKHTVHNCLIDCHADVWTRFPVVPAVKRHTITSFSERQQKTLVFVTNGDGRPFSSHFSNLIHTFERASRKPTGNELRGISVYASAFTSFALQFLSSSDWPVSRFRAGEWLADLLCLIPIHIAITYENRFVPLKDGVVSAELERSLLGAEVNKIVDSLSLGWYESIFQSYWASKPVKVVSSMGEQSVGKSFTLNHLVDTSFAGSAMRTTEGVWMSVSPTDDALIVALDFEGVHSLERSAQEDTLLVLFNTAISNLVLFRNNFALSRNVTGLFQSFQSSSSVLDPTANPTLFQSTLVVIIKDVIDSDMAEVTREFSLKFQKIVQDEQDANFITRLHGGKLQIIPWPVIQSEEFYELFVPLKDELGKQSTSHHTAGEFLHTLKTLMAKLKATDWGAMSQTMAAHRANTLLAILSDALETGFSEVYPDREPLKNFDTDLEIEAEDTEARFLLDGSDVPAADRESCLETLRDSWDQIGFRQHVDDFMWTSDLAQYLTRLVDLRAAHVDRWLKSNVQRFKSGNASIEELRRTFDSAVIDLRAGVQICGSQCGNCKLFCIQSRLHVGSHSCMTSHKCICDCTFCQRDFQTAKPCGQTAGHSGNHLCRVDTHLCGEPCTFSGKKGCLDECVMAVAHEGEHFCSAPVHMCGRPCDLIGLRLPNEKSFSCSGTCHVTINEEHTVHACELRHCPVACQFCKRLCSGDHLHGLIPNQSHLCGQEHSCDALCSSPGICQIDTTPQSIEATFTGRHETFQYTKYTQAAKRLRCVKIIDPGEIGHPGPHIHNNESQPFHFCESRCETCGYLCTLPLGHPQQEHETHHGSMSRTRWAIAGPDGTSLELEGRKFSSNDDGAPMLCNLVCTSMGRHVHIDNCRGDPCDNTETQHINERVMPNPDQQKDWITHGLHWRRMGFKDPYPREEQANFAKCDAMCPGPEHTVDPGGLRANTQNAQPSRCTLALFHAPIDAAFLSAGLGYVSNDGHYFSCKNPVLMQQAFHVIFVTDRSLSMSWRDRRPLANSAGVDRITATANHRLGSVFSSLYSFWLARQAAIDRNAQLGGARRDAYSLIFFNHKPETCIENDFAGSPDELLTAALQYEADGGTDFTSALERAQNIMDSNWSAERTPVIIFLSDGEDDVEDEPIFDICRGAVRQGRPLSFHAVSFGRDAASSSLRRMAQIALEVQNNAPQDPLLPVAASIPSSYTEALDTVRLAETFLGLAESLRKPRGFLLPSPKKMTLSLT